MIRREAVGIDAAVRPRRSDIHGATGSMPFALITAAASGERKKLISVRDALASLVPPKIAPEKTVESCRSPGSGPTISIPGTEKISW